jgi:hypothetical protein
MVSILVEAILYLLIIPIVWVVMTSVVLIGAAFQQRGYWQAVQDGYGDVADWCGRLLDWTAWL